MEFSSHDEKNLAVAQKLMVVLHELANPACDTPEQAWKARVIWDAVRDGLDRQGLNYASIITGMCWLDHLKKA